MTDFNAVFDPTSWCLFNDSGASAGGRGFLLENPVGLIKAEDRTELLSSIDLLEQAIEGGLYAAGFISYEAGYELEPCLRTRMPEQRRLPLLWFALYPECQTLEGKAYESFFEHRSKGGERGEIIDLKPALGLDGYLRCFDKIKRLIGAGDIYQVNLAIKLLFDYKGSSFSLYEKLRHSQPVPYGCFLQATDFSLLSFSPELFFEAQNGILKTRPMKGTVRRGTSVEEDRQLYEWLQGDEKNRAENLMIVDLMRNDFARICTPGSIKVSDLYKVEPYATLYQMTSGVSGTLSDGLSLQELFTALMPAGSITGAPKIRAMEIISQLEGGPREAYCGAMGLLSRDQKNGQLSALFNVAIRTLTLFEDGHGETFVGSGIVEDSEGRDEYQECLLKGKFLEQPDYQLIETMRLEVDGGIYLRQRHLQRLASSCEILGFFYPQKQIEQALDRLACKYENSPETRMIRLLLYSTRGKFEISETLIAKPDPDKILSFIISDRRVDSANTLLAHKTTKRHLFNSEWALASEHHKADEVLFLNERGELTEGSRSNLFIEQKGQLLTPALPCGLLPGTLREQLISEDGVVEKILYQEDLQGAKIYFGNSVRGLQPARLIEKK